MEYFWKKKTIVSYLLSVFVFLIHISSFSNYKAIEGVIFELNKFTEVFFTGVITSYAVTLFFIISGMLFYRNYDKTKYFDKLKSRIRTLLIPFFIWNIIWMLFEIVCSNTFISSYFIGREKFVLTFPNVMNAIFHYGCNGPFWFVFELIFFIIITPIIDNVIKNKYIGFFVSFVLLVLSIYDIGLPYPLFYSKEAISLYIIGGIMGKHYFEIMSVKANKKVQLIAATSLISSYIFFYLRIECSVMINNVINILSAFSFWFAMDLFIDKIKLRDFYSYSFAVYAMHINVSAMVCKIYYLVLPKTEYFAIPNFILTLITTLCIINLFCWTVRCFSPKTYSLIMGMK